MADLVHVDQRKWPDREHYQLEARWLGRDRAGGWIHAASGTIVTRDDDEPWPLPGGFVALAPVDEWWVASFYPAHPELSIYVDITTPPEWDGSRLTFIDLDLDVICRLDGTVEIIDQDEFEENRTTYDYPDELVEGAIAAADRAAALLRAGTEPFDETAEGWIENAFGPK